LTQPQDQLHPLFSKHDQRKLTPMVEVGLNAILMLIISPLDIPPC